MATLSIQCSHIWFAQKSSPVDAVIHIFVMHSSIYICNSDAFWCQMQRMCWNMVFASMQTWLITAHMVHAIDDICALALFCWCKNEVSLILISISWRCMFLFYSLKHDMMSLFYIEDWFCYDLLSTLFWLLMPLNINLIVEALSRSVAWNFLWYVAYSSRL